MGIPKGDVYKLIVKENAAHRWTWHLYSPHSKIILIESPTKFSAGQDAKKSFEKTMMRVFMWLTENHIEYDRRPYNR